MAESTPGFEYARRDEEPRFFSFGSLLRWSLAIALGTGFAAVLYAWPDEAPLGAAVLATATFTVFIVATAACFAPKQQATTSVASGKEKSHG